MLCFSIDESDDDFEDVPEKEGYEEEVPEILKKESGMELKYLHVIDSAISKKSFFSEMYQYICIS